MERRIDVPKNTIVYLSKFSDINTRSLDIFLDHGSELIIDIVDLQTLEYLWIQGHTRRDMRTRLVETNSKISGSLSNINAPKLRLLFMSGLVYDIDMSTLSIMNSLQNIHIWDYENTVEIPMFPSSAKTIEFNGWVGSIDATSVEKIANMVAKASWMRPRLCWQSSYYEPVHDVVRSLANQIHRLA